MEVSNELDRSHSGNNVPSRGAGVCDEHTSDSEASEPPEFDLDEISLKLEQMQAELNGLSELYPQVVNRDTVQNVTGNAPDTPIVTIVGGVEGGPYRADVQSPRQSPGTPVQSAAGSTCGKPILRKVSPLSRRRTQRETDSDSSSESDTSRRIVRRKNNSASRVKIVVDSEESDGLGQSLEYLGERIPTLKPRSYDGSTSWRDYQLHFESVAKGNGW